MTHKNILTKFVIEYDKNNATSSYPSLTEYEIATILDKAYLALIAQKVTGNNVRRSAFETDLKSISDIQPLIIKVRKNFTDDLKSPVKNISSFVLPSDFLYFVQLYLSSSINNSKKDNPYVKESDVYTPGDDAFVNLDDNDLLNENEVYDDADQQEQESDNVSSDKYELVPVKLVPHIVAEKFFATTYNMPWIKIPVCFIDNNTVNVVYDAVKPPLVEDGDPVYLTYIKKPASFVQNIGRSEYQDFECNDTVAEELISLAVAFALENVESQRLNTKLNTRGLEA